MKDQPRKEEKTKPFSFSHIDVIMALLVFLPREFPDNTEAIHRTIGRLLKVGRYRDLLIDFDDFLDLHPFPYSSCLERTLNILKGAGGFIKSFSPNYDICVVSDDSKEIIRRDVLDRYFGREEQVKLEEIAIELKKALGC